MSLEKIFGTKSQKINKDHVFIFESNSKASEFKKFVKKELEIKGYTPSITTFVEISPHLKHKIEDPKILPPKKDDLLLILVLKPGSGVKENQYKKCLEKLSQMENFVEISEPKGKKNWTKVFFKKMNLDISNIFYKEVEQRIKHPKLFNVPIKMGNELDRCMTCKMIGHNNSQCCEGLREIVETHGPNLTSKNTFVQYPGRIYDKNLLFKIKDPLNTTCFQLDGKMKVFWKQKRNKEENFDKKKYKIPEIKVKTVENEKLETLLNNLPK